MADNEEMRLVNISTNGQEVLESIRSEHIDLVILDLKQPMKMESRKKTMENMQIIQNTIYIKELLTITQKVQEILKET